MDFGALASGPVVVEIHDHEACTEARGHVETFGPFVFSDPYTPLAEPVVEAAFEEAASASLEPLALDPQDFVTVLGAVAEALGIVSEEVDQIIAGDHKGPVFVGLVEGVEIRLLFPVLAGAAGDAV